jgi:hypothetical protein
MGPLCAGFSSLTLAVALILAGCAGGEDVWRDLNAGGVAANLRTVDQLNADSAQCEYQWRQASAGAPVRPYYNNAQTNVGQALGDVGGAFLQGAPTELYYSCMRAHGWERVE